MNPIADTVGFLTQPQWPVYVLWLLLLGSLGLAVANLLRDPKQRTGAHVWLWLARLLIGAMWWQQTLWKLPPSFDGLHYWLDQMAQHASFAWQRAFVQQIVQPHFTLFAAMVYAMEVGIAVSLMLGFLTRLGGVLGALQALNLWTGLYGSPEEWTWTYLFLVVIQITFAVFHAGQSLGLDAMLAHREHTAKAARRRARAEVAQMNQPCHPKSLMPHACSIERQPALRSHHHPQWCGRRWCGRGGSPIESTLCP